jgi:hypothetical protein
MHKSDFRQINGHISINFFLGCSFTDKHIKYFKISFIIKSYICLPVLSDTFSSYVQIWLDSICDICCLIYKANRVEYRLRVIARGACYLCHQFHYMSIKVKHQCRPGMCSLASLIRGQPSNGNTPYDFLMLLQLLSVPKFQNRIIE